MKIVRESISNFERGQSPKTAIGIGLKTQIEKYLEEEFSSSYGDPGTLAEILDNSELDKETREKWAIFILSEGYNFDENEWYELRQQGIDVLDIIPELDRQYYDIQLRKRGNDHRIRFSWEDFAKFFGKEDYEEYFQDILMGDGYKYFDNNSYRTYKQEEIEGFVADNDVDESELIEKFEEYGGEDIEEMWNQIYDTDYSEEYGEIKNAIQKAAENTQASAEEGEAWKGIKKSIEDWYDLGVPKYNEKEEVYEATISKQGAERIMDYYYQEDQPIHHREPDFYYGEWDKDTFQMELNEKLSEI